MLANYRDWNYARIIFDVDLDVRKKEINLFATNNINIKQEKHNIKVSS